MAATMSINIPQLHKVAPGLYYGEAGGVHVTIERTNEETHAMYGVHGWYWTVDIGSQHHQCEIAWLTKRDAEWSLQQSWADITAG